MSQTQNPHASQQFRFLPTLLIALAVIGIVVADATADSGKGIPDFTFEFTFASIDNPGASYSCDAVVREQASGNILAAPRLIARKGEEAVAETVLSSGSIVQLKVALDAAGKQAKATAALLEGEKVLRSQTMIVNLGG